jgi:hypothetical protein
VQSNKHPGEEPGVLRNEMWLVTVRTGQFATETAVPSDVFLDHRT